MSRRFLEFVGVAAVVTAVTVFLQLASVPLEGQAPRAAAQEGNGATADPAPKTPWGEPDLQGIWTEVYQTPMERPTQFADNEFFTDEQRVELDAERTALLRRDARVERGTERDVAGAYNAVFQSVRPTGRRTSLVVDPPDGRIPPLTSETQERNRVQREYRLALIQATETCRSGQPECAGWEYGAPSPRRNETPPFYNTGRLNRNDGPEDRSKSERCMSAVLPDFRGYRRIVQSPGSVAMFYDTGQGQGWQRNIPADGSPHLPSQVTQRFGDSRGHWEDDTLVVDVTNFTAKTDFRGSRENLHLVERWTRINATTLEYEVTIEDPTTWTRPWTIRQELTLQNGQANRIYYEPRCHEGNYGLPGQLVGTRLEEQAFAEGRGPDPATKDTATDFGGAGGRDPIGR